MLIKTNVYRLFNNYIGGIEVSIKVVEVVENYQVVCKNILINVLLLSIIIIIYAGLKWTLIGFFRKFENLLTNKKL